MNEESSGNPPPFQITFKEVVVVLADSNEILMNKCLNCNFVTRINSFSKLAHWRNCPSKMLFKYINQNCGRRGYTAICMACRTRISGTSNFQMTQHNKKCTALNQDAQNTTDNINHNDSLTEFDETETADGIEYISENAVSRREMDGQRKLQLIQLNLGDLAEGFMFKYSAGPNGLVRLAECQQCMQRVRRPFNVKLARHRKVCPLRREMLISVSTQPTSSQSSLSLFDMTISSSIIDDDGATTSATSAIASGTMRICFICNTTSSPSYVNLYDTVSEHSKMPLFDFVWKFLDDQPTVRDDSIDGANSNWSMLCIRCFNKINQYDCACVTAARLEQELRDELSQTEAFYSGQNTIDEPNEEQEIFDNGLNGGQQQVNEPNETDQRDEVIYEADDDPLNVPINLDSPPPIQMETNDQQQNEEASDETRCVIEVSDEEEQAIELSDDE